MEFENKVVIVTGASSGIGAAAGMMFSKAGARVVLVGRNKEKLDAVAKRCHEPLVIYADVAKDDDARRIINETIKNFGQIDVLVNNAGVTKPNGGLLSDDMMTAYDVVMSINFRAIVHLTNLAAPYLVKTKGNVVNISSVTGVMPPIAYDMTNYHVSKAALNHFTICAAAELGPHGVRVNVICPGPVKTDLVENSKASLTWEGLRKATLFDRLSAPEEIADLILFLASEKARAISGSNFLSDNGMLLKRS